MLIDFTEDELNKIERCVLQINAMYGDDDLIKSILLKISNHKEAL